MAYKGTNASKIIISLKKDEREALQQAAESLNIGVSKLCAEIIRKHIRRRYAVTDRETRGTEKDPKTEEPGESKN